MNKIFYKISLILLIILIFSISFTYASSDINFDLPGVNATNNESSNETPANNETTSNSESSNSSDENINSGNSLDNIDYDLSEVLQPSTVSSAPETGLGITNIINILLIAVGVILILLAIAILIRLNG